MRGAGFGCCAIAMERSQFADWFIKEVGKRYGSSFGGIEVSFYIDNFGYGAGEIIKEAVI